MRILQTEYEDGFILLLLLLRRVVAKGPSRSSTTSDYVVACKNGSIPL